MADYYGTADGFKAYWTARGNQVLANQDDAAIAVALLIASEWIDGGFTFQGRKMGNRAQVREWPRNGVWDSNGDYVASDSIPPELVNATYVAAGKQLTTPGVFYKDYTPPKYNSVSISGAVSVEYARGAAYDFQIQMPEIAAILAPLMGRSGGFSPLSGSISRV